MVSTSSETANVGSENVVSMTLDDEQAIHKLVSGYYGFFVTDPIAAATCYGEPTLVVLPNEVVALVTRSDVDSV